MAVLTGRSNATPALFETWPEAKTFWLQHVLDYQVYAPEVAAFHNSTARTKIITAPARGSKSWSAAHEIIPYGMPTTPLTDSLHWIVGIDFNTIKEFDYLWERLVLGEKRFQDKVGASFKVVRKTNNPRNGDMDIVIEHGRDESGKMCTARYTAKSAMNELSLQGEELTSATLSEAAEHRPEILRKYIGTRAWNTILPTTPKAKADWLRELSAMGEQDPRLSIETFVFPAQANPTYDWERFEIERRKAQINAKVMYGEEASAEDDPYFAEQFLGRWTYYTGQVLPFDVRRHVITEDKLDLSTARIVVSTDYGYRDFSSAGFWAILPNGIYVRFDEVYERGLDTPSFIARIEEKLAAHGIDKIDYATGDPSRPEVARIMEENGFPVHPMDRNAQRDRAAGHRRFVDLLASGPVSGFPGMYVTNNCIATIAEWKRLHWKEGSGSNEDSASAFGKQEDHAYDDTRYFIMTRETAYSRHEDQHDWYKEHQRRRRGTPGKLSFQKLMGIYRAA